MNDTDIEVPEKPLIPKGFRLYSASKDAIVLAVAISKFAAKAEDIANKEAQLMYRVSETIYPRIVREKIVESLQCIPGINYDHEKFFYLKEFITFNLRSMEGLTENQQNMLRTYSRYNNEICLGLTSTYSDHTVESCQCGPFGSRILRSAPNALLQGTMGCWMPRIGDFTIDSMSLFGMLSAALQQDLIEFLLEAKEFRDTLSKFAVLITKVLNSYTSALKLVETHPEFESWIWKAKKIMDGEKPRCTDIPVVDTMQEVRSILKAA